MTAENLIRSSVIILIAIGITIMYAKAVADDDCRTRCGAVSYKVIDCVCHCATEDGYVRPACMKETGE